MNYNMSMERKQFLQRISEILKVHSVCGLLGPRQCGKTTLAKQYSRLVKEPIFHFDLEDPDDLAKLENPKLTLSELEGLIIIDEIQRKPELFPLLRVLVDKKKLQQKYLILGSASRDLIHQSTETLAGRIGYLELTPFTYPEVREYDKLWIRGGFPPSFLSEDIETSYAWRKSYITTFLERDLPALGIKIPADTIRRFWMMLAHYHGNIFNASEIGKSLGYSDTTIKRYLDILTGTFMVRSLNPWWENIAKRQVKTKKIYFRDSGLFHTLMGIRNMQELKNNPKLGASWEGFALEEVIRKNEVDAEDCYFWSIHSQAELDLLIFKDGKRLGFEFKYADAPKVTNSMKIALKELNLDALLIIVPQDLNFPLSDKIRVVSLKNYLLN